MTDIAAKLIATPKDPSVIRDTRGMLNALDQADLPLAERQRREAEDWQAMRAALVGRHVEVLDEQHALEGVHVALDIRGPAFQALAGKLRD